MMVQPIRSTDGTGTLSYLVADERTKEAILIDPNIEDMKKIGEMIESAGVKLMYVLDTHTHVDHVSGSAELKRLYGSKTVMHENTKLKGPAEIQASDKIGVGETVRENIKMPVDRYVVDGDTVTVGSLAAQVLFTPGHTDNHIAVAVGNALFTGDLLLIGQAGRSDLPGGNAEQQYDSLFKKILPLPDNMKMYPGHDYQGLEFSYLGDEKTNNLFLQQRTKAEYVEFVNQFFPPLSEATASGNKMTLQCGVARVPQSSDNLRTLGPQELANLLKSENKPMLLDVRDPFELTQMGAIDGVVNIPIGELPMKLHELPSDKSTSLVCVCASGSRSTEACYLLQRNGYTNVKNLNGGTIGWIKSGFGVKRPTHVAG